MLYLSNAPLSKLSEKLKNDINIMVGLQHWKKRHYFDQDSKTAWPSEISLTE